MDPLSITAAIVTLLSTGSTVDKALKRVIGLKDAPNVLLALNNEVADLRLLISDVSDILQARDDDTNQCSTNHLFRGLERVKDDVRELEQFVVYQLTTLGRNGDARVDKSRFLRHQIRMQELKDRIRSGKESLGFALSTYSA